MKKVRTSLYGEIMSGFKNELKLCLYFLIFYNEHIIYIFKK